jgi:hypothetical protein
MMDIKFHCLRTISEKRGDTLNLNTRAMKSYRDESWQLGDASVLSIDRGIQSVFLATPYNI